MAYAAAAENSIDVAAANSAATAAPTAATNAGAAVISAAQSLGLSLSENTVAAAVTAIKAAADAAAVLDDLASDATVDPPDTLLQAQASSDTAQLASVVSIKSSGQRPERPFYLL